MSNKHQMQNHNLINKTTAYLLDNMSFYFISDFHKLVYSTKYNERIQYQLHLICKNMSEHNQGCTNYFLKDFINGYVSNIINEGESGIKCCYEIIGEKYEDVVEATKPETTSIDDKTHITKYKKNQFLVQ